MNRTLFAAAAAAAALLLSTGLAPAESLVPGSDQGIRTEQSAADWSVVAGVGRGDDRAQTTYGYPANARDARRGTEASEDRGTARTAGTPAVDLGGALVPGSDSF